MVHERQQLGTLITSSNEIPCFPCPTGKVATGGEGVGVFRPKGGLKNGWPGLPSFPLVHRGPGGAFAEAFDDGTADAGGVPALVGFGAQGIAVQRVSEASTPPSVLSPRPRRRARCWASPTARISAELSEPRTVSRPGTTATWPHGSHGCRMHTPRCFFGHAELAWQAPRRSRCMRAPGRCSSRLAGSWARRLSPPIPGASLPILLPAPVGSPSTFSQSAGGSVCVALPVTDGSSAHCGAGEAGQ